MRNAVNDWERALVTGNGRQGALCGGTPDALTLTVSHERLFFPLGPPLDPPDTGRILSYLPELREMLDAGRYAEAARAVCDAAAEEPRYAKTVWIDPLVAAATVTLRPDRSGPVRDFRRGVDLSTGLVTQRWRDEGGEVRVDVFASRPADAIVVRFRGSAEIALIDGAPPGPIESTVDGLDLTVRFTAATWPGALTGYRVRGRWIGADTLVIRTLLPGDPDPEVTGDFDDLLAEHAAVHGELMDRVRLDLGAAPAGRAMETAELMAGPVGAALVERLFDAGLPPYRIAGGMLAEWCHPDLADQPAHRHASHLWPLWYEPDPLITRDPALREAAVATVRSRLACWAGAESGEMAYGLAQLGLAAAALGLGEEAYAAVELMAGRYWRPNLVPTHNRDELFNVDIAGGLPAVVAAMLVRCAHGRLDLLPARPAAWPRGRVTGLAARDAVRIEELSWAPGRVRAVLGPAADTRLTIGGPPGTAPWSGRLTGGQTLTLSWVSIKTNTSSTPM
jgi:hypothetical protein